MRVNLFTSNFKIIRFGVEVLIVSLLFLGYIKAMNFLLVDDTDSYTRITMYELYNEEKNIDTLFLGSSHCYRSFDTKIIDNYFGENTFNAGSSSQALDGSYVLLTEAGKYNKLNKVFLELYYDVLKDVYSERTELTSTYIISDYLRPSINKYRYLLSASPKEYWINGLWPARRNWEKIFDGKWIAENIKKKHSENYLNYEYVDYGWEYYDGKGFVANVGIVDINNYKDTVYEPIREDQISKDNQEMLVNIIEYCKKNNIDLVVIVAPMPQFRLEQIGNYDLYVEQVRQLLEPYDVEFYDFNLCDNVFFGNNIFYMDDQHLNLKGAEQFSTIFSEFFMGMIEPNELFYCSWEEKMNNLK